MGFFAPFVLRFSVSPVNVLSSVLPVDSVADPHRSPHLRRIEGHRRDSGRDVAVANRDVACVRPLHVNQAAAVLLM